MTRSPPLHVAGLIKERPLDQWRDTLAVIGSHSQLDEFNDLTCALGKRLNSAGEVPEDEQSTGAGSTWAVLPALCPWCVSSLQRWHSARMEEAKLCFIS